MSNRVRTGLALVLACGAGFVGLDCGAAAPSAAQVQGAAIVAGCKVSLDLVRDGGEAGAIDDVETGCEAALKAWRSKP